MLEDKENKLQNNVGEEKVSEKTNSSNNIEETKETLHNSDTEKEASEKGKNSNTPNLKDKKGKDASIASEDETVEVKKEEAPINPEDKESASNEKKDNLETTTEATTKTDTSKSDSTEKEEDILEEIDESNAEDAEDSDNHQRHQIPMPDYHAMPMENLVGELQRLVRNEKVQAIKKHVDGIKYEFDLKFQDFIEEKKEEFISSGGNEIDFRYNSVTKRQFNEVYNEYREKRNAYYKNLEQGLKANLAKRLEIIEELKGLINVEEDINTTHKNFRDIQDR